MTALLVALAALLVGAAAGYSVGRRNPVMHTTPARCLSAVGAISCMPADDEGRVDRTADWTYGVAVDVAWTSNGRFHEGSRPECLPATGRGLTDVVQLTWVEVDAGATGWREVVAVGC